MAASSEEAYSHLSPRALQRPQGFDSSHLTLAFLGKISHIFRKGVKNKLDGTSQQLPLLSSAPRHTQKEKVRGGTGHSRACLTGVGNSASARRGVDTPAFCAVVILVVSAVTLQQISTRECLGTYL